MERRRAQSDDLLDVARRIAADVFIGDGSRKALREELFAESRPNDLRDRDRRSGQPAPAGSRAHALDRDRMEPRNEIALADDAGIGESISRSRAVCFSAPQGDVVRNVGLSAAFYQRTN